MYTNKPGHSVGDAKQVGDAKHPRYGATKPKPNNREAGLMEGRRGAKRQGP